MTTPAPPAASRSNPSTPPPSPASPGHTRAALRTRTALGRHQLLVYANPAKVNLILKDFDSVVRANIDTGMLSLQRHIGDFKTRVAAGWLEGRGFRPRLVERAFH